MLKKITLRSITKDDLEWLRMFRNKNREFFFDNRFISKKQQEKWYKSLAYPFFIIESHGEKIGTIAVKESLGQAEIHNILIDENYRRKGILRQAIAIIEKKYKTPLYVDVLIKNKEAVNAYKKLGFNLFAYRMRKE